jgi:hypothetical protein
MFYALLLSQPKTPPEFIKNLLGGGKRKGEK